MIIHIRDKILEIENDITKIDEILEIINEILILKEFTFNYLIIDDQPVYKEFRNYLTEHITEIKKVEVVLDTTKKMVADTIASTVQYITSSIPQIMGLAEEFYQQPGEKTWSRLIDLFEGIQWIIEAVVKIDGIKTLDQMVAHYEIWNEYVQTVSELNGVIHELEKAMISKDNVLIGDLLLYEIIPVFKKMSSNLKVLSGQRGRDNVS